MNKTWLVVNFGGDESRRSSLKTATDGQSSAIVNQREQQ